MKTNCRHCLTAMLLVVAVSLSTVSGCSSWGVRIARIMPGKTIVRGGKLVGTRPYNNRADAWGQCRRHCLDVGCKTAALVDRTKDRKASTCYAFKEGHETSRNTSFGSKDAQTLFYCRTNDKKSSPPRNNARAPVTKPSQSGRSCSNWGVRQSRNMPFSTLVKGGKRVGTPPYTNKNAAWTQCKAHCLSVSSCKTAALVDRTSERKASTCYTFREDESRSRFKSSKSKDAQTLFFCKTAARRTGTPAVSRTPTRANVAADVSLSSPAPSPSGPTFTTDGKRVGADSAFGSDVRVSVATFEAQDELVARSISNPPTKVASRDGKSGVIFRVPCSLLGTARMDAVISPGRVSEHAHSFFGPVTTGMTVDVNNDFRSSVATTCTLQEDLSMYWVPAIYQRERDGLLRTLPVKSTHYYLDDGLGDMYSMPLGLQTFTGEGGARWFCLAAGYPESEEWDSIPGKFGRDGRRCERIQARLEFPTCWDGRRIATPDQSHVSFPTRSRCPFSHPFRIPQVRSVYTWYVNLDAPGYDIIMSNGDTHGRTMHSDFVSGWPESTFPTMLGKCVTNNGPGCTASALSSGDGPENLNFSKPIPNEQLEGIRTPLVG